MATITLPISTLDHASASAAWAAGLGTPFNVYFDNAATTTNYPADNDVLYTDSALTPGLEQDGGDNWRYYELASGGGAVIQISSMGVVSGTTTTTTTAAPPIYAISNDVSTNANEGDTVTVTITNTGGPGGNLGWSVASGNDTTTVPADFSTWPGASGSFDLTTPGASEDIVFVIDNDLSYGENDEQIRIDLDAADDAGNSTAVMVATSTTWTILDSSVAETPETTGFGTSTVVNNGAGADIVVIDLSGQVTNIGTGTLSWVIETLPTNSKLYDGGAEITSVPHTLTSVIDEVKYQDIPVSYIGTETFTWSVVDDNQSSNISIWTVTVNTPANTAPVADNVSEGIPAVAIGDHVFFARAATDEDEPSLTFEWVNDASGTNTQTLNQINATLTYGVISPTTGQGFKYAINTTLNPNDTSVSDTLVYFRVTDSAGLSDIGQCQFQLSPPGNTLPEWDSTGQSNIAINQGSAHVIPLIASHDDDGHTLTYTTATTGDITVNSFVNATALSGGYTGTLTVTGNSAGNATVTITVDDGYSGTADITYTFVIAAVAYRGLKHSTWTNSDGTACQLTRSTPLYYYDTGAGAAKYLSDLVAGDFLYNTSALTTGDEVSPPSVSNNWVSLEEEIAGVTTVVAAQLDGTGAILTILSCTVTGGNAWPITVRYAANANVYCDGVYEEGEAWQNISDGATLAQVVIGNGQLFASEYYANQYTNNDAPSNYVLADGIYYQNGMLSGSYYHRLNGAWALGQCPIPVEYETVSLDVKWYTSDPTNIGAICNAKIDPWATSGDNFETITIYYRGIIGDPPLSILAIARNRTLIFATQNGADTLNYGELQPSAVILNPATGNFVIWDNDNYTGYEGSYAWYAFNSTTNLLEVAVLTSVEGACDDGLAGVAVDYVRPALWNINTAANDIMISDGTADKTSIYYAFYGCDAKLEPGLFEGTPYYPVYIIDGMHELAQMDDTGVSYISDFIQGMGGGLDKRRQIKAGNQCLTYTNAITATNIQDAVNIMQYEIDQEISASGVGITAKAVSINAIDLGFGSQAVIKYAIASENSVPGDDNLCYDCMSQLGSWDTYTFPAMDNAEILNRTIPNFDLEENYVLDNVSKPLLRTNPKLSTNAKLVANSQDDIFLESIDATKELASVEYKKWVLNPNGEWSYDLQRFFKSSSTPSDIIYATRSDYSDFSVQDSFDKQIEEVYHYGTTYNHSKMHDEDFKMLAPIWLDKDVPNKFVIFRVNDPVGTLDFDEITNFDNIQEVLKNAEIVKTFDLTSKSSLGKYIRNHVNSESFPKSPVEFNFAKAEKSSFKGIDLDKGGFSSKGEFLYKDFVRADNPLIASNSLITDGFERNKLACANLINLEFLFDDDNATDYSINRYFGLYVNDIDSGYGNISSIDSGNIILKNLVSHINTSPESAIPSFKHISGTPTLGYLSISDKFYKISSKAKYDPSQLNVIVEDNANEISAEIKITPNDKSIDMVKDDSAGFDFVKFKVDSTPGINDRFVVFESRESSYSIKFSRHIPGESWTLSFNDAGSPETLAILTQSSMFGTATAIKNSLAGYTNINVSIDDNNKVFITELNASLSDLEVSFVPTNALTSSSIARATQIQTSVNLDNSTFVAAPGLAAGTFNSTSFSLQGTTAEIAKAITGCINNSPINFDAIIEPGSNEFYVKTRVKGYRLLQSGVLIPTSNANSFITLENRDLKTSSLSNGLLGLNLVTMQANEVYYMSGGNSAGKSVLVTIDSVADVAINNMIETGSVNTYNKIIDIVDDITISGSIYKKLILESVNKLESGEQKIYTENIARLGLFSAYDIHDMNFDFYDRSNSDLKELDYETSANINYEPETSASSTLVPFGKDYDLTPAAYFSGISDILPEETLDEYGEVKLWSEYDRLQENNLKQFAIRSRVVPNINKWVLKDSLTVREQPYYLNANEAFGRTNFSPDFGTQNRDRLGMTHEWFYMDNLPKYLEYTQLSNTFSYVNFLDGFELTPAHFKSTSYNYFDRFLISDGYEVKDSNGIQSFIKTNLQKKYTPVSGGNDVSFGSTVFKGIKVDFKNRKEFVKTNAEEFVKSSEFNGYKFSTLVLVRGGNDSNGIDYEVIQNKTFKFVVFLITVSLDDLWIDGSLNRKLLYELNHSLLWNHEDADFKYSDIKLTGALNLNDINFTDPNAADYLVATGIDHADGSSTAFVEQISADEDNAFGKLYVTVTDSIGPTTIVLQPASIDDNGQMVLQGVAADLNGASVDLSNIAGYLQTNAEYVYKKGGKNAFTTILDGLSINNVVNMLKLNTGDIVYTTVDEDGTILKNRFEITFNDGVEIIKQSNLVTVSDDDKPKTFKLKQGNIGFDLAAGDTYYPFLVRHNGNYTLDTTPIVTFTDTYSHFKTNTLQTTLNSTELSFEEPMYKHSLTSAEEIKLARDYYKRYNRCNTSFNLGFVQDGGVHDSEWGIIKNHFYRKVNESNSSGVTKLSRSTDKLPLYPLIGEMAIDKKDVNVFRSSWDKNYYTRSLSGGLTEAVPGTFETKEERSYLGSTIMKVKDSYNMINFTTYVVKSQEEQDRILENNINKTDIVLFEDKKYVYLDFYITSTVKKLLSADGVLSSINNFVTPANSAGDKTTTDDDALLYVENNLLNTFNLDLIKIYTSRIKGKGSEVLSSESISNLDDGTFENDTNFTFKAHEQKPLNFRLIYNKRLGYSYRIRPMIKIQS